MSSPAKRLLAYSFFVFVINAYICHELFIRSYIPAMGSVEGSFISISRYAMENSGDLGWCPLWFNGMPWHNIYQPGLHVSVAAIAKAFQLEPALVYHCLTALFYCLGPVTLFWAAYVLSAEMEASLVVGVLYSLFSPSALIPTVGNDLSSVWFARRFQILTAYGEGPHIVALALIPIAILCLHRAILMRERRYVLAAPIVIALILVTNWTGSIGLALAILCWIVAYFQGIRLNGLARAAFLMVIAYGLCCRWVPPSALHTVLLAAQHANGSFPFTGQHAAFLCAAVPALVAIKMALDRLVPSPLLQFSILYAGITGMIFLVFHRFGFALLPQPHRWLLEMEMAVIIAVVFSGLRLYRSWPRSV